MFGLGKKKGFPEQIEEYLKHFREEDPPYDPSGAIFLLKAILENIQNNFSEYDFEDHARYLDQENEKILGKLLCAIPNSRKLHEEQEKSFALVESMRKEKANQFLSSLDKQEIESIQKSLRLSKLDAVKYMKEKYGLNLAFAKEIVEQIEKKNL